MPAERAVGKGQSRLGQKGKRRSAPRTRTGCLTCKKRRLKCDEGKPACKRCLTFGVKCDGYKSQSTAEKVSPKALLPRMSSPTQLPTPPSEPFLFRSDTKSKDSWNFHTGTTFELPSIDVYSSIGSASSSSSSSSVGSSSPCPSCQGKLKLVKIVNTDLLRSHRASQVPRLHPIPCDACEDRSIKLFRQPTNSFFETEDEHRYFRFFSDKTVANIAGCYNPLLWNQSVLQACEGERSILSAAIAVGALDLSYKTGRLPVSSDPKIQQDHYRYSLRQYNKAIKQMRETVQKRQDLRTTLLASILIIAFEIYHGNHESALDQIRSSVQLLEDWTAPHIKSLDNSSLSPSPHTVEDDLVHAFYRLEIEGMVYIDKLPIECHLARKDDREAAVEKMPSQFQSVSEAQVYGKMLMRRTIHFLLIAWTYDKDIRQPPDKDMYAIDKIRCAPTPKGLAERDRYSAELSRWYAAFIPVLERSISAKDKRDRYSAICLQSHYLCTRVAMNSIFRKDEMWFDTATPMLAEILSLTKLLLDHPDDSFFVFDSQVILPLEIVGRKCRDSAIRHEAIRLMNTLHRREGFIDSMSSGKVCSWLISIEEEGMVDGFIPWEARAQNGHAEVTPEGIHAWCELPKIGGQKGEVVIRDTIIK